MKIQVLWLKKPYDYCDTSLTPELLEKGSKNMYHAFLDLACYKLIQDDVHYILEFDVAEHFNSVLQLSWSVLEEIRRQAYPNSYGNVRASRRFVDAGEGQRIVEQFNALLATLDKVQDNLRESEQNHVVLRGLIGKAAERLKKTRSDKMSSIVGGKLHQIRIDLERLAE
jgi:hypothetical protein